MSFAIISTGEIDVATVSPTRIGAIVNWLVTKKKIVVMAGVDDQMIYAAWEQFKGTAGCVEVFIHPMDYRLLLKQYMRHVISQEGIAFLHDPLERDFTNEGVRELYMILYEIKNASGFSRQSGDAKGFGP